MPKSNAVDKTGGTTAPRKKAPRKFNIKDYQKKQLTNDIKSSSMSKAEVEKKSEKDSEKMTLKHHLSLNILALL